MTTTNEAERVSERTFLTTLHRRVAGYFPRAARRAVLLSTVSGVALLGLAACSGMPGGSDYSQGPGYGYQQTDGPGYAYPTDPAQPVRTPDQPPASSWGHDLGVAGAGAMGGMMANQAWSRSRAAMGGAAAATGAAGDAAGGALAGEGAADALGAAGGAAEALEGTEALEGIGAFLELLPELLLMRDEEPQPKAPALLPL